MQAVDCRYRAYSIHQTDGIVSILIGSTCEQSLKNQSSNLREWVFVINFLSLGVGTTWQWKVKLRSLKDKARKCSYRNSRLQIGIQPSQLHAIARYICVSTGDLHENDWTSLKSQQIKARRKDEGETGIRTISCFSMLKMKDGNKNKIACSDACVDQNWVGRVFGSWR